MTPLHVAIALASLCGVAAWQVSLIPESLMQMTVGPTLVPAVVVGGLALLALIYGISAWRGRHWRPWHWRPPCRWRRRPRSICT